MKSKSIISIILSNKRVNIYTKLLIFLYYRNKDKKNDISDKTIKKYLKIDNINNITRYLKQLEEDKIIKIQNIKQKRYFIWLIEEVSNSKYSELIELLNNYDWLNEE